MRVANKSRAANEKSADRSHKDLVLSKPITMECTFCTKTPQSHTFETISISILRNHDYSSKLFYKQISNLVLCRSQGKIRSRFLETCVHNSPKELLRRQFSGKESLTAISVLTTCYRILPRVCDYNLRTIMKNWKKGSSCSKLAPNETGKTVQQLMKEIENDEVSLQGKPDLINFFGGRFTFKDKNLQISSIFDQQNDSNVDKELRNSLLLVELGLQSRQPKALLKQILTKDLEIEEPLHTTITDGGCFNLNMGIPSKQHVVSAVKFSKEGWERKPDTIPLKKTAQYCDPTALNFNKTMVRKATNSSEVSHPLPMRTISRLDSVHDELLANRIIRQSSASKDRVSIPASQIHIESSSREVNIYHRVSQNQPGRMSTKIVSSRVDFDNQKPYICPQRFVSPSRSKSRQGEKLENKASTRVMKLALEILGDSHPGPGSAGKRENCQVFNLGNSCNNQNSRIPTNGNIQVSKFNTNHDSDREYIESLKLKLSQATEQMKKKKAAAAQDLKSKTDSNFNNNYHQASRNSPTSKLGLTASLHQPSNLTTKLTASNLVRQSMARKDYANNPNSTYMNIQPPPLLYRQSTAGHNNLKENETEDLTEVVYNFWRKAEEMKYLKALQKRDENPSYRNAVIDSNSQLVTLQATTLNSRNPITHSALAQCQSNKCFEVGRGYNGTSKPLEKKYRPRKFEAQQHSPDIMTLEEGRMGFRPKPPMVIYSTGDSPIKRDNSKSAKKNTLSKNTTSDMSIGHLFRSTWQHTN